MGAEELPDHPGAEVVVGPVVRPAVSSVPGAPRYHGSASTLVDCVSAPG